VRTRVFGDEKCWHAGVNRELPVVADAVDRTDGAPEPVETVRTECAGKPTARIVDQNVYPSRTLPPHGRTEPPITQVCFHGLCSTAGGTDLIDHLVGGAGAGPSIFGQERRVIGMFGDCRSMRFRAAG
jgi:hypothetical protein